MADATDTGATDCEISQSLIDELGLTPFDQATFETAAGISMSSALYRAIVRVEGRESLVLLSPSEKDEEDDSDDSEDAEDAAARAADAALDAAHGFKAISDDGLLGHERSTSTIWLAVDGECKVLLSLPELQMHLKRRWRGSRKTSAQMAQEHLHGTMGRVSYTASARPTPPPHPALPSL